MLPTQRTTIDSDKFRPVSTRETGGTFVGIASGEVAGSATAAQLPNIGCQFAKLKAEYNNVGRVYLGNSSLVTKAAGTTTITAGLQLSAGEETGWLPIINLNLLWRICDNAGDSLTYLILF